MNKVADDAAEAEHDGEVGRPATERTEAIAWLKEYLADGKPHAVSELETEHKAAGLSCSWGTVRRAKAELNVIHKKDAFDGGWTWTMPSAQPSAQGHRQSNILRSCADRGLQGDLNSIRRSAHNNNKDSLIPASPDDDDQDSAVLSPRMGTVSPVGHFRSDS